MCAHAITFSIISAAWQEQAAKLTTEEISREEYDQWRYNYPKFDTTQQWANVPSKELSDALEGTFKDKLKTPLSMSYYPQLRAFLIWIYHSHTNHFKIIPRPANHLSVKIIALA